MIQLVAVFAQVLQGIEQAFYLKQIKQFKLISIFQVFLFLK